MLAEGMLLEAFPNHRDAIHDRHGDVGYNDIRLELADLLVTILTIQPFLNDDAIVLNPIDAERMPLRIISSSSTSSTLNMISTPFVRNC